MSERWRIYAWGVGESCGLSARGSGDKAEVSSWREKRCGAGWPGGWKVLGVLPQLKDAVL